MATRFDAIVIGTGQSGPPLASRMADEGLKVAVIERKDPGGTCVNTGCTPTKTLVASARVAHQARIAAEYGIAIGGSVGVDMKRVKARKDEIVAPARDGVEAWMKGLEGGRYIHGHARLESARTVRVNGELLEAERIFIDTGARPRVPDMPGLREVDYLTSDTIMDVDFLPEHLIIVGGSYIGLEFAQMYRRFGAAVTVIEMRDRLIPREDPDIADAVRMILEAEGIEVRLNAECITAGREGSRIATGVQCTEGPPRVLGSHLLLAVGRTPNSDDLGLVAAGVETDDNGYIKTDDELRTSVPGIWALGEVNGRGAFTHTSYNDYEIVAANLFDGGKRRVSDRIATYGLFIDPPLGRAGLSEREVRDKGVEALVARLDMDSVSRARERGETNGFMKVLVEAGTRKILGAALLGIEGDEVVQLLLSLIYAGATAEVIDRAMYIHPTVSEMLPTLFGNLEPLK
jgi:pyruvate/2-oxoglutarate dehydrogenase complex dihydrolipoamide dehydrogenase (E3) component